MASHNNRMASRNILTHNFAPQADDPGVCCCGRARQYHRMVRVIVESPYAGDVERNLRYLRAALADCLRRGEAPYASHGLYTQPGVLDDTKPAERELGMFAGFSWFSAAELVVAYVDLGITAGMNAGLERAAALGVRIAKRTIAGWVQNG